MAQVLYHVSTNKIDKGNLLSRPQRDRFAEYFLVISAAAQKGAHALDALLFSAKLQQLDSGRQTSFFSNLIEFVFEGIREHDFPERPSRLESVFLFTSLADARRFLLEYRRGQGLVYECQVESGNSFFCDMALVNTGIDISKDPFEEITTIQERARNYWLGSHIDQMLWPEVIVLGDVRVLGPGDSA